MVARTADPLDRPSRTQGGAKGVVLIHQYLKLAFAALEPRKGQANFGQFVSKGFAMHPILQHDGDMTSDCAELVKPLCKPDCRPDLFVQFSFQSAKGPDND